MIQEQSPSSQRPRFWSLTSLPVHVFGIMVLCGAAAAVLSGLGFHLGEYTQKADLPAAICAMLDGLMGTVLGFFVGGVTVFARVLLQRSRGG